MSQSAPTNRPVSLLIVIPAIVVILAMGVLTFLNYQHRTKSVKKAPVAAAVVAPVVIPTEQPTYEQVVATPIVPATVQVPVKPAVVVVAVATPAVTTVASPAHVAPTAHPAAPTGYLNHGNFVHGNSNPNWPVK